ncbi:hypothetical protein V8F20_001014 [Naviculisporaceae sp. PSN 640]
MTESPEAAAAARAAEQARLRKERREAKLKAGGASRLNKISGLAGGVPKEVEPTPSPPSAARPSQPASASHGDPEEVDISQHYYQPRTNTPRVPTPQQQRQQQSGSGTPDLSEDALRQMMLGFDGNTNPGGGPPGDDMLLQMMMQSLGGGAGGPGGGFPFPPGGPGGAGGAQNNPFANMMFPGMGQGMPGAPPQEVAVPDRYASLWRLLHTAVALGLGLYIALWTSFSGTKVDRDLSRANNANAAGSPAGAEKVLLENNDINAEMARKFFWAFATAEAVLLTTRFFMDRGRAPPQGLLGTVVGFLPGKIGNYVKIGLQYGQIFSTVKADILVCVFVLGVCTWLRS